MKEWETLCATMDYRKYKNMGYILLDRLRDKQFSITNDELEALVILYTKENGLAELNRQIKQLQDEIREGQDIRPEFVI